MPTNHYQYPAKTCFRGSADIADQITMTYDNERLRVLIERYDNTDEYTYRSMDCDCDTRFTPALNLMSLPKAILYAYEFFGMLPAGSIKELDV